ncbi:MAG: Hypothetical protein C75L2_00030096 [Leptospirillum sp. Group II 'C75']|uniref:Uncharacterized protein n=1 Tax=Leptospirillum sp. Group II '5-way CG' TaxID=419541 RepID=B6AM29_9BACT|nr:MAG: Hypothetical protein CGL2_11277174a [Leptospirillum sp. Group II '5-way CG']EIJ77098.1 MAG: Hypothetical protein C75L2_00030096 [Leptospirillum sp. Group II 'C75']
MRRGRSSPRGAVGFALFKCTFAPLTALQGVSPPTATPRSLTLAAKKKKLLSFGEDFPSQAKKPILRRRKNRNGAGRPLFWALSLFPLCPSSLHYSSHQNRLERLKPLDNDKAL